MKIAVEGCAHGDLDKIYETIEQLEKQNSMKIDLLIICGDFQAVRNCADMQCMAVPPKYRKLNSFYKYYSGVKKAPMLTIFVGGNHEASNYLSELPYGGWVCPNIYYMGYASVINIGGLRIAGLSGIYKGHDYLKGHFEYPPYDERSKKSIYHVRNIEIFRLKQIKKPIDIFISHDWPTGVYNYGNVNALLKKKPFFREEVANNSLGSQPAEELLNKLKPSYWFAAHLHCKFAAVVPHEENGHESFTKFLALDKCLPRRRFLQVIDIESTSEVSNFEYDLEWLSILHHTNHLLSVSRRNCFMPGNGCSERWDFTPTEKEMETVKDLFNGDLKIPNNFAVTAPCHDPSSQRNSEKLKVYSNPQTEKFCETLNMTDPLSVVLKDLGANKSTHDVSFDPNEIDLSDDDSKDEPDTSNTDLDVSGCNDFFIDKTGSHSDSKQESSASYEMFTFPEIKESSSKTNSENLSFPEIKESNVETEKTESEAIADNPLKKFKRRNQSLYQSDDCDL